jgi:hypothetical protein
MKITKHEDAIKIELPSNKVHQDESGNFYSWHERHDAERMIDYLEQALIDQPADPFGSTPEEIDEMEAICESLGFGTISDEKREKYNA